MEGPSTPPHWAIRYYLRVPNEANHHINARLGMDRLEAAGYLRRVQKHGGNELFEILMEPQG